MYWKTLTLASLNNITYNTISLITITANIHSKYNDMRGVSLTADQKLSQTVGELSFPYEHSPALCQRGITPLWRTTLPLTRVCLSVGEDRASTRRLGQTLSRRSCSTWCSEEQSVTVHCSVDQINILTTHSQ